MSTDVDENGYVKRAFFQGPKRSIWKICDMLGIPRWETKKRILTLNVFPSDQVTPEQLHAAQEVWRNEE